MNRLIPFLAVSLNLVIVATQAQQAVTVPVGAVTISIAAGTGSTKIRSALSLPLLDKPEVQGAETGRITGLTDTTISSTGADWSAGGLSQSSDPHIIRITSGAAEGYSFLISSSTQNTSNTITIDSGEASFQDLRTLGISTGASNGDTFEILGCDTLLEVFGTPATTGVLGAPSATAADTVVITNTFGIAQTFFYSTSASPNRWTQQTLGDPEATNTPIRPDSGVVYYRLGATPMTITLLGTVPSTDRRVNVKNSGVIYLSNSWPSATTLSEVGLHLIPGWLSAAAVSSADVVTLGSSNYFHDGTNWRRQTLGSPISNPSIAVGTSLILNRKGNSAGASLLYQSLPYALE